MLFVVVERFPETDPDIQQAKAAANAAEKAVGNYGAERRKRKQEVVVSPLRSPRQNDQQNSSDGADQNKKKDGNAVHPDFDGIVRVELRGLAVGRRRRIFRRLRRSA